MTMTNNLEPSVGDQLRYAQFIKGIERLNHDELKDVVTEPQEILALFASKKQQDKGEFSYVLPMG